MNKYIFYVLYCSLLKIFMEKIMKYLAVKLSLRKHDKY